MKYRILPLLPIALGLCLLFPFSAGSQSGADESTPTTGNVIALVKAVMCEDIQGNTPLNPTTVFSVERRKAICFTSFDPYRKKPLYIITGFTVTIPAPE